MSMARMLAGLAPLLMIGCGPAEDAATRPEPAVPATIERDRQVPAPTTQTPGASGAKSVFTGLDSKDCRLIARNLEEGAYSRHDCPGHAGYRLELIESDLRQNLAIIRPGGGKDELNLSSRIGGGGFSEIGKTVEWRGRDPERPRTLTLRYIVNQDPDPEVPPRSYLVVVRLAAPACAVARIAPGPGQSDRARAAADQTPLDDCIDG